MPYIARPSWLNGGPDQADQKPSSSVGAAPTPGAAEGIPPGSAPAAGATGQPGVQGTGFVNLNQYLQEGRGQAQDYATKNIVNPMNTQLQGVSQDATKYAGQRNYWEAKQKDRTAAETANAGKDPQNVNPAYTAWENQAPVYHPGPPENPMAVWQEPKGPAPSQFIAGLQPLPEVPKEPTEPMGLSGRAAAVNRDRGATGTMEGRGSLFARSAGQGYGHGNFDAFLSGGKPWAGVQGQYPTLWSQIKNTYTPGMRPPAGMEPGQEAVGYDEQGGPLKAPQPRPGDDTRTATIPPVKKSPGLPRTGR